MAKMVMSTDVETLQNYIKSLEAFLDLTRKELRLLCDIRDHADELLIYGATIERLQAMQKGLEAYYAFCAEPDEEDFSKIGRALG